MARIGKQLLRMRSLLLMGLIAACDERMPAPLATPEAGPPTSAEAGAPSATWEARASLPFAQQESAAVAVGGKVYVLGGLDDRVGLRTVSVFDPTTGLWTNAAPLPRPLHHVNAAVAGGRIWVAGALEGPSFVATPDVFVFDPATNEWTAKRPMRAARGGSMIAASGSTVYVAGGLRDGASVADFSSYDIDGDLWTELPPLPVARDHGGGAATETSFFAIGGRNGAHVPRVDAFDVRTRAWSERAPMPTSRAGIAVAQGKGRVYVAGGEGDRRNTTGVFPEVEAYDPATNTWIALPPMRTPRHGMGAAVVDDLLVVPSGGTVEGYGPTPIVEVLRLEAR